MLVTKGKTIPNTTACRQLFTFRQNTSTFSPTRLTSSHFFFIYGIALTILFFIVVSLSVFYGGEIKSQGPLAKLFGMDSLKDILRMSKYICNVNLSRYFYTSAIMHYLQIINQQSRLFRFVEIEDQSRPQQSLLTPQFFLVLTVGFVFKV